MFKKGVSLTTKKKSNFFKKNHFPLGSECWDFTWWLKQGELFEFSSYTKIFHLRSQNVWARKKCDCLKLKFAEFWISELFELHLFTARTKTIFSISLFLIFISVDLFGINLFLLQSVHCLFMHIFHPDGNVCFAIDLYICCILIKWFFGLSLSWLFFVSHHITVNYSLSLFVINKPS